MSRQALSTSVSFKTTEGKFIELTQFLEHLPFSHECDMKKPATTQRSDWRLDTITLTTDDFDLDGAIGPFWISGWNPVKILR